MNSTEMFQLPYYGIFAMTFYFIILLAISFYRARSATLSDYYIGSHNSTWWMITLGMISDSVSGVTFVSIPGAVLSQEYSYFQIVLGYFLGYLIITNVLLPLYYRRNLISIYSYLGDRFGAMAQKSASILFISSRTFGSAARLYISVMILHGFLAADFGIHPAFTFAFSMAMIALYTYKGGIKSLVWTEAYQSVILLLSVIILLGVLMVHVSDPIGIVLKPAIFNTDPLKPNFFLKSLIGGMLITCSMNGLDQNIMQMNLSCRSLADAKKNMFTLAFVMVAVNFVFLALGALLGEYYQERGLPIPLLPSGSIASDQVLPFLALHHLGKFTAVAFIFGLSAATFSSAGTILPAIASSIEIDLLPKRLQKKIPVRLVHALAAVLIFFLILWIHSMKTTSIIDLVLRCSGYTYGPLIALYGLGIFTRFKLKHQWVPLWCILAIGFTAFLDFNSESLLGGYRMGVELIAINALFFLIFSISFGRERQSIGAG
jgi:SSS family solute:Na+ symporter